MIQAVTPMEAVTAQEVRDCVREFWEAFTKQSQNKFQELYSPTAICFAADGRRSEPGRLMWVRREREFFGPRSSVGAKVGLVNVQVLAPALAVASYPFHFSIIRVLPNGNRVEVEVPYGRATQVFRRNEDGRLIIIHEHLSSAEPVTPKELPKNDFRR
jgi:ketosteroid isomerase-like protein